MMVYQLDDYILGGSDSYILIHVHMDIIFCKARYILQVPGDCIPLQVRYLRHFVPCHKS